MTVLQIKTFWNNFKLIFTTTKSDYSKVDEIVSKIDSIDSMDTDTTKGIMIITAFFYAIFLTTYYILTGIYLGGIGFFILSCIFIARSWKNVGRTIKWLTNTRDKSLFDKTILTRLYLVVYLTYMGYFEYVLITTW